MNFFVFLNVTSLDLPLYSSINKLYYSYYQRWPGMDSKTIIASCIESVETTMNLGKINF